MTDLPGGYMYCCSLEEAAAAFKEIDSLGLSSSGLIQAPGATTEPPTEATAPAGPQCLVNLDNLSGKYPPILTSNNEFVYPTSQEADGTRFLKVAVGASLDLYCHGSLRYQATTTVVDDAGADTGLSKLSLVCNSNEQLERTDGQV